MDGSYTPDIALRFVRKSHTTKGPKATQPTHASSSGTKRAQRAQQSGQGTSKAASVAQRGPAAQSGSVLGQKRRSSVAESDDRRASKRMAPASSSNVSQPIDIPEDSPSPSEGLPPDHVVIGSPELGEPSEPIPHNVQRTRTTPDGRLDRQKGIPRIKFVNRRREPEGPAGTVTPPASARTEYNTAEPGCAAEPIGINQPQVEEPPQNYQPVDEMVLTETPINEVFPSVESPSGHAPTAQMWVPASKEDLAKLNAQIAELRNNIVQTDLDSQVSLTAIWSSCIMTNGSRSWSVR